MPLPPAPLVAAAAPRRSSWPLAALLLACALLAAYANSFRVPFLFDDPSSISENLTLRSWRTLFLPPADSGITVSGRPLLNATFALNWALGHENVTGYHATNLLIHVLAALTLFGLIRRTLLLPSLRPDKSSTQPSVSQLPALTSQLPPAPHTPLALAVSALWALHPLQTESVTYIVQRAESLVGLCYLLTLYGFVRSIDTPAATRRWQILTVLCCLAGMASKEVMVSAPLIVVLFDRTFVSGSFAAAWRARKKLHLALAATWLLLAACILSTGNRGGTVGLTGDISAWNYFLTQCQAILHYLRLTVWPHPLILDYGTDTVTGFAAAAPHFFALLALGLATLWALWKKPAFGFLGAVFFAVLAPTSSVVPVITQTMAEHRMYLALAPLVACALFALHRVIDHRVFLAVAALLSVAFATLTFLRNRDYATATGLWHDNLAKAPANIRALANLASIHLKQRDFPAAESFILRALAVKPDDVSSLATYAGILAEMGRNDAANAHFERVLSLNPRYQEAHYNYGKALLEQGDFPAAISHLETAVSLRPKSTDARYNLGNAFLRIDRAGDAVTQYDEVLRLDPSSLDARNNRGNALVRLGRHAEALADYDAALRQSPEDAKVLINLGRAHVMMGDLPAATGFFQRSLAATNGDTPEAHANLANALASTGRPAAAIPHYQRALQLGLGDPALRIRFGLALQSENRLEAAADQYRSVTATHPDLPDAHQALANLLLRTNQPAAALPHYHALLKLAPRLPDALNNLGIAYAQLGRLTEARASFEQALKLSPDFAEARENLERTRRAAR